MDNNFRRRTDFLETILQSLPSEISKQIKNQDFLMDSVGKSGSAVLLFENDLVLKIEQKSKAADQEYQMLKWLQDKLSVPKIKGFFTDGIKNYLLMTRLKGKMVCDPEVFENEKKMVKVLAKGLQELWQVDITDCPISIGVDEKLNEALIRVETGLVDVADAEPETFGESGFKDPMDLYLYLQENQPSEQKVFVHGDYCLPNVFVEDNEVSGFLDLGRAGIGDKWQDIALAVRSLKHNLEDFGKEDLFSSLYKLLFAELGFKPDEEKIRYYILLDELY